jgi:hypothetical protein
MAPGWKPPEARTQHEIHLRLEGGQHGRNLGRIVLAVGVDEDEDVTASCRNSSLQCDTLAAVPVEAEDPGAGCRRSGRRVIGGTIVDHDHFG